MSYYGFPEYVSVADKKAKAMKTLEKMRKKDPDIAPVIIEGRKLASTWWGKAWNDNLESYSDYENRIGRGRSYVRHGSVLDLRIAAGKITALVQGSMTKPYSIDIVINPLDKSTWETVTKECEGKIDSLQELISGKFPKALSEMFTAHSKGLFPAPKEIRLNCSCPDSARMCKHVAAALYGVGARLDENPALFFTLRNVNIDELVSKAIAQKTETLLKKSDRRSGRVMDEGDISAMFGIEMENDSVEVNVNPRKSIEKVAKAAKALKESKEQKEVRAKVKSAAVPENEIKTAKTTKTTKTAGKRKFE